LNIFIASRLRQPKSPELSDDAAFRHCQPLQVFADDFHYYADIFDYLADIDYRLTLIAAID